MKSSSPVRALLRLLRFLLLVLVLNLLLPDLQMTLVWAEWHLLHLLP